MSCVSPILVKTKTGVVNAPCGRCLSCCVAKQSALNFLCEKELQKVYSRGLGASFCTLTYNDNNVPYVQADKPYMTLQKGDLQKYLKRLRDYVHRQNLPEIKFLACGEYGDKFGRPHYHLVFFGLSDALANAFCRKAWKYGQFQCGALSSGGLRYVLKYMTKSRSDREIEQFYDSVGVQKPFIHHSQALGRDWIFSHADEIASSGYVFIKKGKKRLYPKYVRDLVSKITGVDPRPFIQCYFDNVNTKGLSLNDFLIENTYKQEMQIFSNMRYDNQAVSLPSSLCRPKNLRISSSDTDYKALADIISFGDSVPF